jgi:hypothetical protein
MAQHLATVLKGSGFSRSEQMLMKLSSRAKREPSLRSERESRDLVFRAGEEPQEAGPSVALAAQAPFALLQDDNY